MPRAIWSGSISFGLVNIPVKLFTATESKDIRFQQFADKSRKKVKYKRVAEGTNREVDYEDIVKGYEVKKGQFVMVDPDELEEATPEKTKTIEIEDFVGLHEIDPIHFEKTYYIAPDGKGAGKAYTLLLKSMEDEEKVAIGRFVMRTKEYLVAIRPLRSGVLALETLYFADEIRAVSDINGLPVKGTLTKKERDIATRLISSLTTTWDPKRYRDTYRERVLELIERKAEGEEIVTRETAEEPAKVTDLIAALEASLEAARGRSSKATKRRAPRARKSA